MREEQKQARMVKERHCEYGGRLREKGKERWGLVEARRCEGLQGKVGEVLPTSPYGALCSFLPSQIPFWKALFGESGGERGGSTILGLETTDEAGRSLSRCAEPLGQVTSPREWFVMVRFYKRWRCLCAIRGSGCFCSTSAVQHA